MTLDTTVDIAQAVADPSRPQAESCREGEVFGDEVAVMQLEVAIEFGARVEMLHIHPSNGVASVKTKPEFFATALALFEDCTFSESIPAYIVPGDIGILRISDGRSLRTRVARHSATELGLFFARYASVAVSSVNSGWSRFAHVASVEAVLEGDQEVKFFSRTILVIPRLLMVAPSRKPRGADG